MTQPRKVIEIQNVVRMYKVGSEIIHALDGICLDVHENE